MQRQRITDAVRELLVAIGEDPDRPELRQTPEKVADAYASFFKGVGRNPLEAIGERFPATNSEAVLLRDIELVSICEHHLLAARACRESSGRSGWREWHRRIRRGGEWSPVRRVPGPASSGRS